jgi:hypothetical protein
MGNLREGRPFESGLLFAPDGNIIFAGRFVDEKPHGEGIRIGTNGPEQCVYDHGKDMTKPLAQLAREAVDLQEREQYETLLQPVRSLEARIIEEKERKDQLHQSYIAAKEKMEEIGPLAEQLDIIDALITCLEEIKAKYILQENLKKQELIEDLPKSRFFRELIMRKQIMAEQDKIIDQEQTWCQAEIMQGRRWCLCAPFDKNYLNWPDCLKQ